MRWVKLASVAAALSVAAACAANGDDRGTFVETTEANDAAPSITSSSDATTSVDTGSSESFDASADVVADVAIDVAPGGNPLGFPCAKAQDCISGECKNVVAGASTALCVTPCTAQTDCPANFFCDPSTPGAASGFCAPRSPAHCKTCSQSSECGALSETCGTADGDTVKACHVDCSIAGADACPPDYECVATTLDGAAAKVCRPSGGLSCLDALGGFCDRVATPQTCKRSNTAGQCVGQRTCLTASTRYDNCGAQAPVCKMTCSTTDPAGCTTSYCTEATSGVQNCGACGNVCPGWNQTSANVTCEQPTCTFACKGEKYDIDGNKTNGCEVSDPVTGNHNKNDATFVGDRNCKDGSSDPAIGVSTTVRIPSDARTHDPAVDSFDSATGSAPDWYRIHGTGSTFCVNNVVLTLQMSSANACYHLHIETNKNTYDCNTDATGKCAVSATDSSQWDDGTDIFVEVYKRNTATCNALHENPSYTVKGHF